MFQISDDMLAKGIYSIISATLALDQEKLIKFKQDYENDVQNNNIESKELENDKSISEQR